MTVRLMDSSSRRCAIEAAALKYSHHTAALPRKATEKAASREASRSAPEAVAQVATLDSPRPKMMKRGKRSAKWPTSIAHADGATRGSPGTQNVHSGPE